MTGISGLFLIWDNTSKSHKPFSGLFVFPAHRWMKVWLQQHCPLSLVIAYKWSEKSFRDSRVSRVCHLGIFRCLGIKRNSRKKSVEEFEEVFSLVKPWNLPSCGLSKYSFWFSTAPFGPEDTTTPTAATFSESGSDCGCFSPSGHKKWSHSCWKL